MRQILFVSGQGGVGKTRRIAEYAQQWKNSYSGGVYLFNAQSILSFHQSLKINVSQSPQIYKIHISISCVEILVWLSNVTHNKSVLWDYNFFLRQLDKSGNVLFVYDSCDNLEVIERLLPKQAQQIHVIVTTRTRGGHFLLDANHDRVIHLDVLEGNDAVYALLEWKGNEESERNVEEKSSAEILVNVAQIGRLRLAIRHAGLYLREKKVHCEKYGELLDNRKDKLQTIGNDMKEIVKYCGLQHVANALEEEGIANVRDFVRSDLSRLQTSYRFRPHELEELGRMKEKLKTATVMTWDMQIEEMMKNSDSTNSTILEIASLIDGKVIARDLLLNVAFREDEDDPDSKRKVEEAISHLSNVSLLNDDVECSMHGLVQQNVVEAMMRKGTFARRLRFVCKCLVDMLPRSWDDVERNLNKKKVLDLAAHVYVLSSHILQCEQVDEECWQLLQVSCWIARAYWHLKKAEHLCEGKLDLVKRLKGKLDLGKRLKSQRMDKEKLLSSLIDVGNVRLMLSNPQEAERSLKEALEMSREWGDEIQPTLQYEASIFVSSCYILLHQFETSEQLCRELLEFTDQQGLSQEHVSRVIYNLAVTYENWGNTSAAIENNEKNLKLMRKQLNGNQVTLSQVITNLAFCYQENGELERAVSYYEEALTISRRELQPSHPALARGDTQALRNRVHSAFVPFRIDLSPAGSDAFSRVTLESPNYELEFDTDFSGLIPYEHTIEPLLCVDIDMPSETSVSDVNQGRREDITRRDQQSLPPLSLVEEDDGFAAGSASAEFLEFVTGNGAAASLHSESVVSSIDEVIPPDEPAAAQVDFILSPSEVDFELEEVDVEMPPPKRKRIARVPFDVHTKLPRQVMRSWIDDTSHILNYDPIESEIETFLRGLDPLERPITTLREWCFEDLPKSIKQIQDIDHDTLQRQDLLVSTEGSDFLAGSEPTVSKDDLQDVVMEDNVLDGDCFQQEVEIPQEIQTESSFLSKTIVESEENLWRKLQEEFQYKDIVTFSQLCPIASSRSKAAKMFYNLLSLASTYSSSLFVQQMQPFGEITMTRSEDF
ncbi:uncharacterized protein LOC134188739 isoform X2 [Corticium candelabrum]|uniref:uncharacterized protein LOC134188739 isoform X2 n=1 Tax=Corticium candelabrum TaxID=121492 RepID=UPI002E266922|nr:uncharacterized protein LOC134188739 isoform X2 [Corticium candelabrum]